MTITSKNLEPIGGHLLIAGEVADTTAKGILAYPGIETLVGETEVTYTDNSKTITSIAVDRLSFVVSANTNLFVGQCIKVGTSGQVVVITGIASTTITVDRVILAAVLATQAVTESAYYSAMRFDKDSDKNSNWRRYARFFYLELKGTSSDGRQDLVTPEGLNVADYYVDANVTTKPISMLKINASNIVTPIYFFKSF